MFEVFAFFLSRLLLREKIEHGMLIDLGALAQLVERNNGIVEVNGSIPLRSTSLKEIVEQIMFQLFHSINNR